MKSTDEPAIRTNLSGVSLTELLEAAGVIGIIMVVFPAGYLRGHMDASGMGTEQWALQVAETGPYWPHIVFGVGMAVLGVASVMLFLEYRRQER